MLSEPTVYILAVAGKMPMGCGGTNGAGNEVASMIGAEVGAEVGGQVGGTSDQSSAVGAYGRCFLKVSARMLGISAFCCRDADAGCENSSQPGRFVRSAWSSPWTVRRLCVVL